MKKIDIEFERRWLDYEASRDHVLCASKVCKKCNELIDMSDESQYVYKCPYALEKFHNIRNFDDMIMPDECKYRLEHVVVRNKMPEKKTKIQIIEEMEDDMIHKMEMEHYGE